MAKRRGTKKNTGPTMDELNALAAEMNEIMGLDPEIDAEADGLDEAGLIEAIKDEAFDEEDACQIYTTDEFSKKAWTTLTALGIEAVEPPDEGGEEEAGAEGGADDGATEEKEEKKEKPAAKAKPKAKAKAKPKAKPKEKEKAKPKEKPAPRYTRMDSCVDALKDKKVKTISDAIKTADDFYVEEGGTGNEKESRWAMNNTIKVLVAWEAIEVDGDKFTIL